METLGWLWLVLSRVTGWIDSRVCSADMAPNHPQDLGSEDFIKSVPISRLPACLLLCRGPPGLQRQSCFTACVHQAQACSTVEWVRICPLKFLLWSSRDLLVAIQYFSRKTAIRYIGTKPGQNLQALGGPLWTRERGTFHSCLLWQEKSRLGTGVNWAAERSLGCSVDSVMTGPQESRRACSLGWEVKAFHSPDPRSCKLKWLSLTSGCPWGLVPFTLNLSPAPSLPHKGTVGAKRRRGGCVQERRDRGVAVKGTATSSLGIERLRRGWGGGQSQGKQNSLDEESLTEVSVGGNNKWSTSCVFSPSVWGQAHNYPHHGDEWEKIQQA